jgi:hypothetical protein
MRCDSCGKEVSDFVMDYHSVPDGSVSSMKGTGTRLESIWLCRRCASYRRRTYRLFWGIIGAAAALGLLIILLDAVLG